MIIIAEQDTLRNVLRNIPTHKKKGFPIVHTALTLNCHKITSLHCAYIVCIILEGCTCHCHRKKKMPCCFSHPPPPPHTHTHTQTRNSCIFMLWWTMIDLGKTTHSGIDLSKQEYCCTTLECSEPVQVQPSIQPCQNFFLFKSTCHQFDS